MSNDEQQQPGSESGTDPSDSVSSDLRETRSHSGYDEPASTPYKDAAENGESLLSVSEHTKRHSAGGDAPVKGYRQLDEVAASRINSIKAMENEVGKLMKSLNEVSIKDPGSVDARFLAVARTDLQKGFMSMVRAVAQPVSEL